MGTREAWYSDIQPKVYESPTLWYLRVEVIEARDLQPSDRSRDPQVFVNIILGNQSLNTKISQTRTINPLWQEEFMFVAAEPFEDPLILTVVNKVAPNREDILGKCEIPLQFVFRRFRPVPVKPRWFNLEKHVVAQAEIKYKKFSSRIHLRICLEGGYHVLDESANYSTDLRPTAKHLWGSSIGFLELGILSAEGFAPMKTRDGEGTTDAYCVAKYGHKWVRTKTIVDSLTPKWDEQYTWEVYDPCTVIIIGVFDNGNLHRKEHSGTARDLKMGKVRIRLSVLETDRLYTLTYPLSVLHPSGVKKMGAITLAVRLTFPSLTKMYCKYLQPPLPEMHYLFPPLTVAQLDMSSYHAINLISRRLSLAEPPLGIEVVQYILDADSHMWSMRKSKSAFFRIMVILNGLFSLGKWFYGICHWKNPIKTLLIHIFFIVAVLYQKLILPILFLHVFVIGIWNYRWRPRYSPHMNPLLSQANDVHPDEIDEEYDTFPTSRPSDIVRMRYDRLRMVSGRIMTVGTDVATQGEKLQSLISWTDRRATAVVVAFCFISAMVLLLVPFRVVVILLGCYVMRHPCFRSEHPSVLVNFFRRLTSRSDSLF